MKTYKGSQRCILELISSPDFLKNINSIISSAGAIIESNDNWIPQGLHNDKEAELKDFLAIHFNDKLGNEIRSWWLAVSDPETRTPNWDMVSTCTINNQKGLLLVEAKAHYTELDKESVGKTFDLKSSKENHERIKLAIAEANENINKVVAGVSISRDNCYQLSNRIAHAWWLANKGIPVVLMYLGFLKADDMQDGKRTIFGTTSDWENCFFAHAKKVGVDKIINKWVNCGQSSFITICRSL